MAGETVTITASPYVGWQCDSVTATISGTPLEVNQGIEGGYSFIMPEGDVDVMVFFSRSTGNLFELVETRSNITEGLRGTAGRPVAGLVHIRRRWLQIRISYIRPR